MPTARIDSFKASAVYVLYCTPLGKYHLSNRGGFLRSVYLMRTWASCMDQSDSVFRCFWWTSGRLIKCVSPATRLKNRTPGCCSITTYRNTGVLEYTPVIIVVKNWNFITISKADFWIRDVAVLFVELFFRRQFCDGLSNMLAILWDNGKYKFRISLRPK